MKAPRPLDWMEQERERGDHQSHSAATTASMGPLWQDKYRVNIIDTPVTVDFTVEVERFVACAGRRGLRFDSVAGVQPQSETVGRQADKYRVPRI